MSIVYKKSLKGIEEIALRSNGLQLRLRAYLILVDGAKSVDEIKYINPSMQEVDMIMSALHQEGYLEIVTEDGRKMTSNAMPAMNPPPMQENFNQYRAETPFPATTNEKVNSAQFSQARDDMVRDIMTLLGKDAQMVVTKIQRCETPMDLFAMMMGLKKIITMYANNAKAEEFGNKYSYLSSL
jgi:hypothetical protein